MSFFSLYMDGGRELKLQKFRGRHLWKPQDEMRGKWVWRGRGRHAIYLSAVDRRVIICADDVAHRTGRNAGWGHCSWSGKEGGAKKGKQVVYFHTLLCLKNNLFSEARFLKTQRSNK